MMLQSKVRHQDLVFCEKVSRSYVTGSSTVTAVDGADCRVAPGTQVALTGPSGSGKSTLLHLLAGLDNPTAGEIGWPALGGHPAERAGLVGIIFQGPSLLPPLDVAENTALPLLLAGIDENRARARAASALATVGVADLGQKLPEELSGGQAQRVAVARVLAGEPQLVLADEPTGQLGSAHAAAVVDALVEVATALDAGLVVATHDQAVAKRLPHRWSIRDGSLTTGAEGREGPCCC